jgi:hypothetical protein
VPFSGLTLAVAFLAAGATFFGFAAVFLDAGFFAAVFFAAVFFAAVFFLVAIPRE